MHQEYYDGGKLAARAAGWGAFGLFFLWPGGLFGVLVGAASLLIAMVYIAKATANRVAIRFGQDAVERPQGPVTMIWGIQNA